VIFCWIESLQINRNIMLDNADLERGHHRLVWDGRDEGNRNVASGVYFIRLDAAGKSSIRKAMLLK
jgi:flagellar hook assembly protein FlgD